MYVEIGSQGMKLFRWSAQAKTYKGEDLSGIIPHLRTRCEFAAGLTLGELLRVMAGPAKDFFLPYSQCDEATLSDYLKGLDEPADPSNAVAMMQVAWACSSRNNEMTIFPVFNGREYSGSLFGFINTPLSRIKHAPVALNRELLIADEGFSDGDEMMYTTRAFTLLDVLGAVYWEIGFHGKEYSAEYLRRVQVP